VSNSLIVEDGGAGIRTESVSTLTAVNNTIAGNNISVGVNAAIATLTNNLITGNTRSGIYAVNSPSITMSFNDVYNPSGVFPICPKGVIYSKIPPAPPLRKGGTWPPPFVKGD
jgi:parallel beta-helix repeat protein